MSTTCNFRSHQMSSAPGFLAPSKPMRLLSLLCLSVSVACGAGDPGEGEEAAVGENARAATSDETAQWQPFTKTSLWNTQLPPGRAETPLPAAALNVGPFAPSDAAYGIKVYLAKSTDPLWTISYRVLKANVDGLPVTNPLKLRAPAGMLPPTGSDGTVIIVDENRKYAYELWQFAPTGPASAKASGVAVLDTRTNGLHREVGDTGISGSGLPGSAGLLKSYEIKNGLEIRHKLWLAFDPKALYKTPVWPATWSDAGNGAAAAVRYGEVVALTKNFNIEQNECALSPGMKRIARALQSYGAIVMDQCGGSICIFTEVDAVKNYLDVNYYSTMWNKFACLKKYLVKVPSPWGGPAGGLGY